MARCRLTLALAACAVVLQLAAGTDPLLRRALNLEPNAHLQHLATISDTEGSLARTFFSPAHRRAAQQIQAWMRDCGMDTWVDVVGNVHGRINSTAAVQPPAVLLGSHYDTVLDGGAYDGALGIIVGLAAVKGVLVREAQRRGLADQLDAGEASDVAVPPALAASLLSGAPVHLVAFSDEEGVRFQSTFLGSRAVVGTLVQHRMLGARDRSGASLEDVLAAEGGAADPAAEVAAAALPAGSVAEYVEVHIEQGPVLEASALPLGVVVGIAGQTRLWVDVAGTQGHAGTVPMRGRRDSLAAAAEIVTAIEALCNAPAEQGGAPESDNLVCTVGELKVWPGASNVIAGGVGLSVDVRSKTDAVREAAVQRVLAAVSSTCGRRGVACSVDRKHDAGAVLSDAGVLRGLSEAARAAGPLLLSSLSDEEAAAGGAAVAAGLASTPQLVSGAGHDAMAIAEVVPKMAMLFVRCRGGVSHSPLEHVEPLDVAASSAALAAYLADRLLASGGPHDEL